MTYESALQSGNLAEMMAAFEPANYGGDFYIGRVGFTPQRGGAQDSVAWRNATQLEKLAYAVSLLVEGGWPLSSLGLTDAQITAISPMLDAYGIQHDLSLKDSATSFADVAKNAVIIAGFMAGAGAVSGAFGGAGFSSVFSGTSVATTGTLAEAVTASNLTPEAFNAMLVDSYASGATIPELTSALQTGYGMSAAEASAAVNAAVTSAGGAGAFGANVLTSSTAFPSLPSVPSVPSAPSTSLPPTTPATDWKWIGSALPVAGSALTVASRLVNATSKSALPYNVGGNVDQYGNPIVSASPNWMLLALAAGALVFLA